jgi:hypothetical protein
MKNLIIVILLFFTIFVLYTGHTITSKEFKQAISKTTTEVKIANKKLIDESSKIVSKKDFFTFCSETSDAYVKFLVKIHDNIIKE